jgi:2-hydroxymuconate-semialdehyde hydrolase
VTFLYPLALVIRSSSSLAAMFVAIAAHLLPGCVTLSPFDEVRRSLPAERFAELDGRAVYFERQGAGETVVLIHGFGGSTFSFRKVAGELARNYDVIALDLHGFGYTQRPTDPSAYSLLAQRDLVLRLMDHLGVARAHIVGHSYGAGIALLLAQENGDRVRSIILVDGGSAGGAPPAARLFSIIRPLITPFAAQFLTEPNIRRTLESAVHDPAVVDGEMVDGYLRRLKVEGLTRAFRGFSSPAAVAAPEVRLQEIDKPTLILWGERDTFIPIAVGERLAAAIAGAEFVRFERVGHLPLEEIPEASLSALRVFLQRQAAAVPPVPAAAP